MRILQVHNFYQQPGGEDSVVESEAALLRKSNHEVVQYFRSNKELERLALWEKLLLPKRIIWASDSVRNLREIIVRSQPDIAHFHNTFLMISPAAYYVCRKMHVPVVQSLHNPRLMCPAASFYRNGTVCVSCLGKPFAWPGVLHACYHRSRLETASIATMVASHRLVGTWSRLVDRYIVFTNFYRKKFIEGGLPQDRISLKPHFVAPDPGVTKIWHRSYALFIGRLDPEKGLRTLLNAWSLIDAVPLKIRGEGQLLGEVHAFLAEKNKKEIELVDQLSRSQLIELIKGAKFLVWPSEGFYETFGLVAIDAFACGVPVIASRIGVLAENVEDGRTGLHFTPGDAEDLAAKVRWAVAHPNEMRQMGLNARRVYEQKYTPEANYRQLIAIYEAVIDENAKHTT